MPQWIESEAEFIDRHAPGAGRTALVKVSEKLWLLPDGASIENHGMGPILREPPAHPERRLEFRRRYYATLLDQAEADFRLAKDILTGKARDRVEWRPAYGPPPAARGPVFLARLKEVVHQLRNAVADIDRQYGALPAVRERNRLDRERAKETAEADAIVAEQERAEQDAIAAINID